ncbi:SseB family protein [Actibacterium sp.]|uniref:SseB family protein n=1 Tax=Actibacterium sp. TaxID=1872125 RepID=UPI003561A1BA
MADLTRLDVAHQAMETAPHDDAARLKFFERLADSELFLLLESEPDGDNVTPRTFDLEGGAFVLVFDREERLAEFVGDVAPYAALSGRLIANLLQGQGIGLGVNLGVAVSSILIPSDAVDWLCQTLDQRPSEVEALPVEVTPPAGVPDFLLQALDSKLVTAAGLAPLVYLVGVTYEGGQRGHMLAFIDALPGAEGALAQAAGEALTFSGIEAGAIDVAFFRASEAIAARLARVGLRFDIPEPPKTASGPSAPGRDPDNPPRLR